MKLLMALLLLISLTVYSAPPSPAAGPITVTGTLFPEETDTEGNPLMLYVEIFNKEDPQKSQEYPIAMEGKWKELTKALYHTVTLTGSLRNAGDGRMLLSVQQFELIPSKPEDLDDIF